MFYGELICVPYMMRLKKKQRYAVKERMHAYG